ncbi:MAG: N-acetylglucosamine-specific PTS transporter subunit IIBC [Elainellaceae cyanobacterium]
MNIFGGLQRLGKALMLPIAVLPAAGLLLRLGAPDVLDIPVMTKAGGVIFDNLAAIFAVGIALGLAKDNAGAAGLAALVGYYIINIGTTTINEEINMGVLAGIIVGVTAGLLYNRFYNIKLPDYLQFFGGRRFVPIVTGAVCLLLAIILGFIWPPIQAVINAIGTWIVTSGLIGAFFYGVLNRLLIPLGLHHVLNSLVWFVFGTFASADGAQVTGDLNRYFAGDPTAGTFMAGFYPVMMFGLPAACLAMVQMARPENRRMTAGIMLSMALTSFITGITEPIEFSFMFLAPVLYGIHAVLTGISMAVLDVLGVKHGFTFSAGAIDYVLNYGLSTKGWMIIPFGILYFGIYYFLFRFCIQALNLKTPGREDEVSPQLAAAANAVPAGAARSGAAEAPTSETTILAERYINTLGGLENIKVIDSCITRLRLTLVDRDRVSEASLKALGAKGVIRPGTDSLQVIIGPMAETIAEEMKTVRNRTSHRASPVSQTAPVAPAESTPVSTEDSTYGAESSAPPSDPQATSRMQAAIAALGGLSNIHAVEAVALTRLRLEVEDSTAVNEAALAAAGVQGVMYLPNHKLHLLVGLNANQYAAEMKKQLVNQRLVNQQS